MKEAGEFLGRFGWPNAVKSAPTKIDGQLSWDGAPSDFDYPTLTGSFKLRSGAGQFTKVDPGVGRLLGVLSLQALPRRISLDFRDVFSEGFAFDTITARRQDAQRRDAHRRLPPRRPGRSGRHRRRRRSRARDAAVARARAAVAVDRRFRGAAAALFIANPLIGAAVGAGTLLAQKMLNNPFDQLFSYEYAVTGSWDDPVVARSERSAPRRPRSRAPSIR